MIQRTAASEIEQLSHEFRVIVVTGPRQSGKTTLVRSVFPDKPYALLEELDTRSFASEDPRRFLAQFPNGAVLDEVQRVPELLSYVMGVVDQDPAPGRFVLTGSSNLNLMESVTQTLAGRAGHLELLPFSLEELQAEGCAPATVEEMLYQGQYPAIYDQHPRVSRWYDSYLSTYVERDVRQLVNIGNLATFQRFLGLCAANTGQILNMTRLGSDCGIHHNTVRSWLGILQISYILFMLQPHFRNFRKRLVKSPKLYFYDTGLAARLLRIENPQQIATHPLRGALFENWCTSELMKARLHKGKAANLYFWRAHKGLEVDVVADHGTTLLPVEIKSGATVSSGWFESLKEWQHAAGDVAEVPWIVHAGDTQQVRNGVTVLPWSQIKRLSKIV